MMISRYYRWYVFTVAVALMLTGAGTVLAFVEGWSWVVRCFFICVAGCLLWRLFYLVSFLIRQMDYFLQSLVNHDFMVRFPETRDSALKRLYTDMNQIVAFYRDNLCQIETKQVYYDRILRVMTHELRNSITPMVSLSDDLIRRADSYSPELLHEGLELINGQCMSIKKILDAYHRLTHLPQPKLESVNIRQLFEKQQKLLSFTPEAGLIHFSWGKEMELRVDPDLISQVLTNLIKNAVEATAGKQDASIEVIATSSANQYYITVSDNGPGISRENLETIFLPFFTTKSEGTGIGLCLSRQIMQLHGGNLTVSSRPGFGAAFMMCFG